MEKNFYRDQFEQMLKDTADSFRMYPSRKIWHSIYNDIHPARKWPSFAVLLLLTASIMYIGVTNPDTAASDKNRFTKTIFANNASTGNSIQVADRTTKTGHGNHTASGKNLSYADLNVPNTDIHPVNDLTETETTFPDKKRNRLRSNTIFQMNISSADIAQDETVTEVLENSIAETENVNEDPSATNIAALKTVTENNDELSWKEDMAFYARQQKARERFSYQIYATPSVGYRTLTNNATPVSASRDALVAEPDQNNYFINHTNSFNLEFGGNVLYDVNEKLRFKAGVQLNVTSYLINAFVLSHPVTTNILLKDQNTGLLSVEPRSTMISNSQGLANTYLNNSTFQFSVPLGADIQIIQYKKLKLMAGATIQPTYVSGGNAYLLSSDMKNYINDPSLLRKFNLNGGVETFVSYQLKNGVSLNAGPQVRYQFLSTYNNEYSYSEKLYNIGVKFGITSRF